MLVLTQDENISASYINSVKHDYPETKSEKYSNIDSFDSVPVNSVEKYPYDINGLKKYMIKCDNDNWCSLNHDAIYFLNKSSLRKGIIGRQSIGKCQDTHVCINDSCPRYLNGHECKKVQFNYYRGNKVCLTCGTIAVQNYYGAIKVSEFDTERCL